MNARLLSLFLVALALLATPGCFYIIELDDPRIYGADAFCSSDGWWDLTANVEHPDGGGEVQFVWAEVTEVFYDRFYDVFVTTYLGEIDLFREGSEFWAVEVRSDRNFLDCFSSAEYDIRFVAQDFDGDRDSFTITR